LTAKDVENPEAIPVDGLPPVTAHAYVYGVVPPLTMEVKLSEVLTVPEAGPLTDTLRSVEEMLMRWNADAVAPLWSVTVNVMLYVPFTANIVENVDAVPADGLPPVTAHAYV
jgi:hypothetical protein